MMRWQYDVGIHSVTIGSASNAQINCYGHLVVTCLGAYF
ncbi:hypothetical protein DSUL_100181 [Desulfovibrionales bacterium]